MEWDIVCLVFVCVTANHLGLVGAVEGVMERELPVVNCPKCVTFWSVLAYTTFTGYDMIPSLTISLLCSYAALWLELLEGFIDTLYTICYEKVYTATTDDAATEGDEYGHPLSAVSDM